MTVLGFGDAAKFVIPYSPVLLIIFVAHYLIDNYFAQGLHRYPGPVLAKFGKLWHRIDIHRNSHQLNLVALHRRLGDVVRIGPTTVSISDPSYIPKVYGMSAALRKNCIKSDMYDVFAPRIHGKIVPSLLSERDPKAHAKLHKPMAREFTISVISGYEPLVDKTLRNWIESLDRRFANRSDQVVDMARWARLYATEAIMDMTFSESMGFIKQGGDVHQILARLDHSIDTAGLLIPMPWTAYLVRHNPIVALFRKDNTMFPSWIARKVDARVAMRAEHNENTRLPDFLDSYLDAAALPSAKGYDFHLVRMWCLVNVLAGADTTAVGLSSIIHDLLHNSDKLTKLTSELRSSNLSTLPTWKECQALPYLDSCIMEGWRLHPSIGLGLEREGGGLTMPDGYVLPVGAKVSMNAWVVNRQPQVFGEYVDDFLPERWLKNHDESHADHELRIKRMRGTLLNFGAGSRACTGRYIAYMETYKAIATLFREFDVTLVDPQQEWDTVNRWLTRVSNIQCRLKRCPDLSSLRVL